MLHTVNILNHELTLPYWSLLSDITLVAGPTPPTLNRATGTRNPPLPLPAATEGVLCAIRC